jgi:hypothetical protein
MALKRITYIGHHHPDGLLRRVFMRTPTEGWVWVSHVVHGYNGNGESITQGIVQPLPTEESRIEIVSGDVFVREDAVEPGGAEGGLRLRPAVDDG